MGVRIQGTFGGFEVTGDIAKKLPTGDDWPFEIVTNTGVRITGVHRLSLDGSFGLKLDREGEGARILDFNELAPIIEIDGNVRSIEMRPIDNDTPVQDFDPNDQIALY